MPVPYAEIIADAREKHVPSFFSCDVKFEYNETVSFSVAWSSHQGDEMTHLHNVKDRELGEVIEEARRRCEWENGRGEDLVEVVIGNHGEDVTDDPVVVAE